MKANQRSVRKLARLYGLRIEEGKKHLRILDGERLVAVAPRSAGSRRHDRGLANLEATLRRVAAERGRGGDGEVQR